MTIMIFELLTAASLAGMAAAQVLSVKRTKEHLDNQGKPLWSMRCRRIGTVGKTGRSLFIKRKAMNTEVDLSEERYLVGNRLTDEFYIDTPGRRVRFFINVQKDVIYLSVIQGSVTIAGYVYNADTTKRIEITDMTKVVVSDLELEFWRKRGW